MKYLHTIISISLVNLFFVSLLVTQARVPESQPQLTSTRGTTTRIDISTPVAGSSDGSTQSPTGSPVSLTESLVPTLDNRCIVMVDGGKYDVTDFRKIHSGGDVFQCGTEMTQIFYSRHDKTILDKMQKYLTP